MVCQGMRVNNITYEVWLPKEVIASGNITAELLESVGFPMPAPSGAERFITQ